MTYPGFHCTHIICMHQRLQQAESLAIEVSSNAVVLSAPYLQERRMSSSVPVVGLRLLNTAAQNQQDLIGSAVKAAQ
jgi:hypothetical protein